MDAFNQNRLIFIDHLRAFVFTLLVFDHTAHAYASSWGKFHFIQDFDRSLLGDIFYMNNNSIIMPMLFFIFGLFVLPSFQRRGALPYLKARLIKLGIPYLIGIPFVVPLLVYPRFHFYENPLMTFSEFWSEVYFTEKIQGGGPFWVLYCLFLFTVILLLLYTTLPKVVHWVARGFVWMAHTPFKGFWVFSGISMVLLGFSDLRWGAPWWIGFGHIDTQGHTVWEILDTILNLFHLQGSRFMVHALYFTAGVSFSLAGLLEDPVFWEKLSQKWLFFLMITVGLGVCYIGYSLAYLSTGAYSNALRYHFLQGGNWSNAGSFMMTEVPMVLLRTSLHGLFCLCQSLTLLAIFRRFFNTPNQFGRSLAVNSYGIFLFHEIPVIWLQYWLISFTKVSILVKVGIIFSIGLGVTWFFVSLLRRIPGMQRIL